ncbi:MAG: A24 family peptidase [Candidatus Omnitrophica bacterium]|nr:A24 family peptidase [Candidatus Omnitrophota bacterium]
MMDMLTAALIFGGALMVGSFLNVCIYRLPRTGRVTARELQGIVDDSEKLWEELRRKGYLDEEAMITEKFFGLANGAALDLPQLLPETRGRIFDCFRAAAEFTVNKPRRSFCPHCGKMIAWFDNIPVFSYLFLRGRCRGCRQAISARYLIVELTTAIVAAVLYARLGFTAQFFVYSLLACGLIVATFIDFEFQIIPDEISLGGIVVGAVLSALLPQLHGVSGWIAGVRESGWGIVAGGGSIYLIGELGKFLFRKEAMGGGDVKFLAMVGSFLGWQLALLVFFLAPFFGAVVGIIARLRHGAEVIPYGPYLSLAAFLAMLYGRTIIDAVFWM